MIFTDYREKTKAVANERLMSLVGDGYFFCHLAELDNGNKCIVKLRHRSNGNNVVLVVDYRNRRITQSTNGKITHREIVG